MRGATWSEFDLDAAVWTIPGTRMKAKEPHRVPLSSVALALVKRLKELNQHETLVFPSPRGKVLSDMAPDGAITSSESEKRYAGARRNAARFQKQPSRFLQRTRLHP
ncbi:tyrosine-type recombinase/integrase [Paraburkholderia sp. J12]|uniref:tyrosine-type recombinase/integrase n=1 Tax=Paraburkholderia sp. J12 TaxID=2805432 RepID=UPI002ABD3087|nr:tyrosine-type recombinase/integrase [Paraburkholderia sp. J12]